MRMSNGTFAPMIVENINEYLRAYLRDRTNEAPECWEWFGPVDKDGFASVRAKGYRGTGHRLSYELAYGPIPQYMVVLQRCENRTCVNPGHLYLATRQDVAKIVIEKGHHGDAHLPLLERITRRVEVTPNGCWEWQGHKAGLGYGVISVEGKAQYTHRLMCEMKNGPIPEGCFALHRCDNPPCCNPDHLFIGTPLDNSRDMATKGRWRNQNGSGEAVTNGS